MSVTYWIGLLPIPILEIILCLSAVLFESVVGRILQPLGSCLNTTCNGESDTNAFILVVVLPI